METGYEDSRFETQVDEGLHCAKCEKVLRDPVQCYRNEDHFCRYCITELLGRLQKCPTCKDPLTVETLARPQRFLANTLSSLKISCDNSESGCRNVVELGSLNAHVATCGFSPVRCSNDQCDEIISRRDKEIHENKVCGFRRVECDYCAQIVLYKNFMQHICTHARHLKAKLEDVRSKQDEMSNTMENMISSLTRLEINASSGKELQAEIVVAGGCDCKSVEAFNMPTKTWRPLSKMNECRIGASSVLYQGRMMVTGGTPVLFQPLDSVEELNIAQQDGHWVESQFKLPVPFCGHACVVYKDCAFVIGGRAYYEAFDTIHEIQLTTPESTTSPGSKKDPGSKVAPESPSHKPEPPKMPTPICYHGAEVVNGKIYIFGGITTRRYQDTNNTVLMFDPETKTCTQLKPLPYPVSDMATATWKDNVVVLGGYDNKFNSLNTVILYNVITESYRMLPEMTKKRHGCTAVSIGNYIITMGGLDEAETELNSVECYNLHTNTWTEFPAMAKARVRAPAVVKYY